MGGNVMEVNEGNINEAIIYLGKIKDILWPNISNAKYKVYEEKIINIMALLNELRKLKSLEAENKVYRNEQSGWVKEIERRQAKIRELEKLDLNVRGLMLENKKLKKENKALRKDKWELEGINEACRKENKAYREMWEESKKRFFSCEIVEVVGIISKLEEKYLGGVE